MAATRLDEIIKIRKSRIDALRDQNIDPYPPKLTAKKQTVKNALDNEGKEVAVAGRLMAWREHGNIIFGDIKDESGQIQLFFQKKSLGDEFKVLKKLDIGDFIFAEGLVFKTEAGELTIDIKNFQILAKSLRPLPSSFHGLKDIEERYRKRYLDLLMNEDVKKRFELRSKINTSLRSFLDDKGFIEVETPTLQPVYGGGFAKPFTTHHNALDTDFYLRISDEMYLKRLIVGGYEKVYEITKVFRNEGIDHDHNPEFTMFEAQIAYEDYNYGMDLTENMIEHIATEVFGTTEFEYEGTNFSVKAPWKRMKLVESVREHTGIDTLAWTDRDSALKDIEKLQLSDLQKSEIDKHQSLGTLTAFLFEEFVEDRLIQPTIIYDYPVEVSPLAKRCEDDRFTQRFEVFALGMELGNNYSELNDPIDLKKRFIEEKNKEKAGFDEAHQTDEDYLEAIEYGFPPTCGLGIGIDRLVMIMTNAKSIREVITFPTLRPIGNKNDKS